MKVFIVLNDPELGLEVSNDSSVSDIKLKIEQILGASPDSQTLSVFGWELVDGLDMEDYPIVMEGTRINLIIKSTELESKLYGSIQLAVKLSSKQIKVGADITETVRSLKEKIHIMDGTPLRRMTLYYLGIELDEEFRNLFDYGVKEGSEIVVFLKTTSRVKVTHPCKSLSLVVQTSSALMNSARFPMEVKDSSPVGELARVLVSRKILPYEDYIFIHKQRIMRDSCSLGWHGVENGDFLYVFKGSVSHEEEH